MTPIYLPMIIGYMVTIKDIYIRQTTSIKFLPKINVWMKTKIGPNYLNLTYLNFCQKKLVLHDSKD